MIKPRHPEPFHMAFTSAQAAVRSVLQRFRTHFEIAGLSPQTLASVELVLAEVLNNVAEHAYAGQSPGPIDLSASFARDTLCVTVCDDGCAMPGGSPPPGILPEVGTAPETLPEGGFGWFLIHDLTQEIDYCREGGKNRLDLRFSCTESAG